MLHWVKYNVEVLWLQYHTHHVERYTQNTIQYDTIHYNTRTFIDVYTRSTYKLNQPKVVYSSTSWLCKSITHLFRNLAQKSGWKKNHQIISWLQNYTPDFSTTNQEENHTIIMYFDMKRNASIIDIIMRDDRLINRTNNILQLNGKHQLLVVFKSPPSENEPGN